MANDKLIYAHVNFYDPPEPAMRADTKATPDPEESAATIVVRCKDCANSEDSHMTARIWCGKICRYMPGDGYCSMGVNR